MIIEYIKSNITGGHYGFRNENSKKPFTNKMTEAILVDLFTDDVVVDIGAYVGEYSLYASKSGVSQVISYEPTLNTFNVLKQNCTSVMEIHNKAVVGDDSDSVELYIANGIGVTNSITKKNRKKDSITVPAIRYENAIKDATVVKIDTEGAEYGYNIVQPHVRAYIIEFHPITGIDWKYKVNLIMEQLHDSGYIALRKPTFKHGWDLHGAWVNPYLSLDIPKHVK